MVQVLARVLGFIAGTAALYVLTRAVVWFVCLIGAFVYGYEVPAFTL